ncbi:prephenate dehydrogenase [Paenibacillus sp. HN-1]|uniref:prephenate dehydrogenase n=1 Tax=Paenibacillus TaxID=44249 RepID=UPI001CA84A44|nr:MULTISPECIES: prephenate dehydrogenase [Paenibacillus]MBY9081665.1 prephenate dehydrogenase [Paenibacillus sp. CGMCC 1.18879]MBY9083534.1 prephenate dehydrogenase [Paenibacillus sinensis]
MTTKISIFGVGLIGGSLALCFKGKPGITVVGHAHRPESADKYVSRGVVDSATLSFEEAALDSEFIFLCVPVGMLEGYMKRLSRLPLKKGCIITDVGSTKGSIADCAEALDLQDVHFIGGHPMAGSERSGVEAASSLLFENAYYVLTPPPGVSEEAYEALKALLVHTKAQIVRLDPHRHDEIVGAISHLPHIIAVALVNQVHGYDSEDSLYSTLAAGGFRDITRIASSEPVIWRDILLNNRSVMLRLLQDWNEEVSAFVSILESGDGEAIEKAFEEASGFRSRLPERRKGMITPLFDLHIDVPDHPGIIGRIATELGDQGINLSNVQIIESREDVPGIMRLSFRQENDMERAKALLQQRDYTVYV